MLDHRESTATTTVFARMDTLDALDLDASLSQLATTMGRLGDDRDLDIRRDWLDRTDRVSVRPVLDMNRTDGVDAHDPPTWLRELVTLRVPHCVFPGCTVDSRVCDLDHLEPYVPPGSEPDESGAAGQ